MGQLLKIRETAEAAVEPESEQRVLVADPISERGLERLRNLFAVETGDGWTDGELLDRVEDFDALVVRSATTVSAEVIERAERLRVIVRAGIGVDNVDVAAATRRGVLVANAPESTVVSAAEHTLALIFALARNVPQADRALHEGEWARSRFAGTELEGKTLAVLGFGRIGYLVATKARGLGMHVIGFDPFVGSERFSEVGAARCEELDELLARADFLTIHLPKSAETKGIVGAEAFAKLKPGARVINCARGGILHESALEDALEAGVVAGAALDVFEQEPLTEHPLFARADVIVTPHLGASTKEAQEKAGIQAAESVIAALEGEMPANAVNLPGPNLPIAEPGTAAAMELAQRLGALTTALIEAGDSMARMEVSARGRLAELGLPLLSAAALAGALRDRSDAPVNYLNAPVLARERGIAVVEMREPDAEEFIASLRVSLVTEAGKRIEAEGAPGHADLAPRLLRLWDQLFDIELGRFLTVLRYEDKPGMLGYVGAFLGERNLNISAAAVGRQPAESSVGNDLAAMAIVTERALPPEWLQEILEHPGFTRGRTLAVESPDGNYS